jgi:hypothetical protein
VNATTARIRIGSLTKLGAVVGAVGARVCEDVGVAVGAEGAALVGDVGGGVDCPDEHVDGNDAGSSGSCGALVSPKHDCVASESEWDGRPMVVSTATTKSIYDT